MKIVPEFWTLDDNKNPIPCDIWEWGEIMDSPRRIVAQDYIGDEHVSTVFLGLDHGWGACPLIFETMIFAPGKDYDQEQWRCSTWADAEQQHAEALKLVRGIEAE
ncbi:MAG: hypothetical protein C5B60_04755 [Chloroflexi bacterium]|nr:MAG: hypothetical protein C5B60_04755 [Chloroflexota bacterium]